MGEEGTGSGGTTPPRAEGPGGADLVGTVLAGRYRILERLGEGAMGEVYLGEHVKIGRRDAIKVLRGPLMRDPEAVARFNRGARNVAAVQHPNVCTIYDFSDTDDGIPFLAMEFISGESLKELLDREGPLPVERVVHIGKQVADALFAAHLQGIVHRDLKPANVMLLRARDGRDEVRVVDFDIAKGSQDGEDSEVTRLGFVIGTPEYMSPEQLMAERLDGRSDVYSLGIMLFRMLTGVLPFQGGSAHETVFQRLTNPPMRLDEVAPGIPFPGRLQQVLDRALQRRPDDRYDSAADLARDLVQCTTEAESPAVPLPLSATGIIRAPASAGTRTADEVPATRVAEMAQGTVVSPVERAAPTGRRGSGVLVGGGAGALAVVLGLGWFLVGRETPPGVADTTGATVAATTEGANSLPAGNGNEVTLFGGGESATRPREPAAGREPAGAAPRDERSPEPATAAPAPPAPTAPGGAAPPRETPPPAAAPASPVVSPVDLLRRQRDRSGETLTNPQIVAQRDTAAQLWQHAGLTVAQRAQAAAVAATASDRLGNRSDCRLWAERSLTLNENRAARALLEHCSGGY